MRALLTSQYLQWVAVHAVLSNTRMYLGNRYRHCGCVAVWLCGFVAVWLCVDPRVAPKHRHTSFCVCAQDTGHGDGGAVGPVGPARIHRHATHPGAMTCPLAFLHSCVPLPVIKQRTGFYGDVAPSNIAACSPACPSHTGVVTVAQYPRYNCPRPHSSRGIPSQPRHTLPKVCVACMPAMGPCAFMAAVVAVTSLWVYLLRARSFTLLALAMFFPGVAALAAEATGGDVLAFLHAAAFGARVSEPSGAVYTPNIMASVCLAGAAAFAFPLACAVASLWVGWARFPPPSAPAPAPVHAHNRALLSAFARAAGEELGWRCWLLPRLLMVMPPLHAFLLSGLAWGQCHSLCACT